MLQDNSVDALFQFDSDDKPSTVATPDSLSMSLPGPSSAPSSPSCGDLTATGSLSSPVLDPAPSNNSRAKQRELPPTLPALDFETPGLYYISDNVSASPAESPTIATSFSGSSTFTMSPLTTSPASLPTATLIHSANDGRYRHPIQPLHRPRSLSNISLPSTRSAAARSLLNIKSRLTNSQTKNSKALSGSLFSGRPESVSAPSSPLAFTEPFQPFPSDDITAGVISGPHNHVRSLSYPPTQQLYCTLTLDGLSEYNLLGRNLFNELLPRELQLRIFSSLVGLHLADHERNIALGKWTTHRASSSRSRWVGRDRGFRELVKFSRVCRSWREMVFDGQLWATVDLRSFPALAPAVIDTIMQRAASFVKQINLTGNAALDWEHFKSLTDALTLSCDFPHTQLTEINLQGCKGLTARALHYMLMRCPSLTNLCLKGLEAVTEVTCEILASSCPEVKVLNMSRCHNLNAIGLKVLADTTMIRGDVLALTKLYLSGLNEISDSVMMALGKVTPHLEVLDLSYCDSLHNSSIEAFISVRDPKSYTGIETVTLTAKQAGRELPNNNNAKYTRRLTKFRHLILSSCPMLTDIACSHLAHAVPRLEILELAGLGEDFKEGGLIHLLETIPRLRKLDLEDCCSLTDNVLRVLTPPDPLEDSHATTQVGAQLEELVLSYAIDVSEEAMIGLIRGCPNLKVLEADNTRIGSVGVKEFVKIARSREMEDARIVVTDCRGVGETIVKEMHPTTRARLGWVGYEARKLKYVDGRDEGAAVDLKIGQDELDSKKVVLKSFHSWQTVDAVFHAREKRRKRKGTNASSDSEDGDSSSGRSRWWTPNGRRRGFAGRGGPQDLNAEGCIIM